MAIRVSIGTPLQDDVRALVDAIVDRATAKGISRLALETGAGPGFAGAWRLYEKVLRAAVWFQIIWIPNTAPFSKSASLRRTDRI